MKYLLNIAFFSTIILLVLACTKDDENIIFQDTETLSANNELRSISEDAEITSFISQPNPVLLFKLLDKDNDGKISQEEAENGPKKRLAENFDRLDANRNGFIEKAEIAEFSSKLKAERKKGNPILLFKLFDRDNDDKISQEEAENGPKKRLAENFDRLDANKDGFIKKAEIAEFSSKLKAERKKGNPVLLFKLFDKDNDGNICQEEAGKAPKKRLAKSFDRLDKNSDGFIDKEEVANLLSMIQFH